jgi:hypothetical protein
MTLRKNQSWAPWTPVHGSLGFTWLPRAPTISLGSFVKLHVPPQASLVSHGFLWEGQCTPPRILDTFGDLTISRRPSLKPEAFFKTAETVLFNNHYLMFVFVCYEFQTPDDRLIPYHFSTNTI